jgi:hypothetical protein
MSIWEKQNSPFILLDLILDDIKIFNSKDEIIVPKSAIKLLKYQPINKHADLKYKEMRKNKELSDLYDIFINLNKEILKTLPADVRKGIQSNSIMFTDKGLMQSIFESPLDTHTALFDKIKESIRNTDTQTVYSSDDKAKIINTAFITANKNKINDLFNYFVNLRTIGKMEGSDLELRKKAMNQIAEEKSYDLGAVMKTFALQTSLYKHKLAVKEALDLTHDIFDTERQAYITNAAGMITKRKDDDSVRVTSKGNGYENFKSMFDVAMQSFYNYPLKKIEGKTSKKVYTNSEKLTKAELEKHITELTEKLNNPDNYTNAKEIEADTKVLNNFIDRLNHSGGYVTGSAIGDSVIKYVQLKGLGWNIPAMINNVAIGQLSNLIYAGGNTEFTSKEFFAAQGVVLGSVSNTFTPEANKVANVMMKYDVLKSMTEISKKNTNRSKITNAALNFLSPMSFNQKAEYLNQAPIAIAIMKHTMLDVTVNGENKQMSYWNILDSNGVVKPEITISNEWNFQAHGEKAIKLKNKIDKVISRIHGNYDEVRVIKLQTSILGRAVGMFRKWMFEGFMSRFEETKYDNDLERNVKGRWRSYSTFGKALVDNKTNFKKLFESLEPIDKANMKSNLIELAILTAVASLVAVLKALKGEDDDDELSVLTFIVNQGNRITRDILFYTIVSSDFDKLINDPLPATKLFSDITDWGDAVYEYTQDNDEIAKGVYAGESRLARKSVNFIPGLNQINKFRTQAGQILESK